MKVERIEELEDGSAIVYFHMEPDEASALLSLGIITALTEAANKEIERNEATN